MDDERMRVEVLIGFDADKPDDAIDPFCDHLRSVLPGCEDIEITSLRVRGEVADPDPEVDEDKILLTAWVDFRSGDPEKAEKEVFDHLECDFWDSAPLEINALSVGVELLTRRREAIEATKAKRAKRSADASE